MQTGTIIMIIVLVVSRFTVCQALVNHSIQLLGIRGWINWPVFLSVHFRLPLNVFRG